MRKNITEKRFLTLHEELRESAETLQKVDRFVAATEFVLANAQTTDDISIDASSDIYAARKHLREAQALFMQAAQRVETLRRIEVDGDEAALKRYRKRFPR